MDKQFEQLTKLAKKYDEEANFKQADEITELMIKIAESSMPLPQKPAEEKGLFGTIGSTMGQGLQQGLQYLGSGIGSAAKSVGNAVSSGASQVGNAIVKPFKNLQNANTRDRIYQEKAQGRYQIDLAIKNILDQTADQTNSNKFNEEQARTKAKNLAKQHSNLNYLNEQANSIYKVPFEEMVDLEFDRYIKPIISNTPYL